MAQENGTGARTPAIYMEVTGKLAEVKRKETARRLGEGIFLVAALLCSVLLVSLGVEALAYLGTIPRTILFALVVLFAVGLAVWFIGRHLGRLLGILRPEPDAVTARKVGAAFPSIKDRLVNVLQLFPERDLTTLYSVDLIDASFEDLRRDIAPIDFASIVDAKLMRKWGRVAGLVAVAGITLVLLFPMAIRGAANRLWNYSETFSAPAPFELHVEPGNREVVKGENVQVVVRVTGSRPPQLTLASKPSGQVTFENHTLVSAPDGSFRFMFERLTTTTAYAVYAGSVESDTYTLTVADRPIVKMLRLQLDPPKYTRLPPRALDDNVGDVTALRGTRIGIQVETNKELAEATLVFSDKTETPLSVHEEKASGTLSLMSERTYHLRLRDKDGTLNADPIEYTLRIVPDAFPTVTIAVPGMNMDIAENLSLPMVFRITDDFGFSRLRLAYKLVQSRYEKPAQDYTFVTVPLPSGIGIEGLVQFTWSLQSLSLVPEDVVSYYAEVFDNDVVSGPKSAVSETYTLRLPSLDEVFADADKAHDASLESMKETMQRAEEARKDLEDLQQDLKKNREKLDWQDQKKAEELVKKYEDVRKNMEDVNRTVDQMVNELQKNQVLSKETLEKYQELQQMLAQMDSPEFSEAMKKLQQAMQQMSPEAMKQALQQFSFSEENFRKGIERTLNLLKRIQIEQKVDEAVKRMEDLKKQQEDLQARTEQTGLKEKDQSAELAQRQRDLKEQAGRLQKELDDLQKKMEEFPGEMPLSSMEKLNEQMEKSELDKQMSDVAQQMQQQQLEQALQGQQQAGQKMSQLGQQLQQVQQEMRQNQMRQVINEMRRAMQDLLQLSQRQEELKGQSQGLEANSPKFRENAQEQMDVLRDLGSVTERLSGLSQKTFGVTPEMGKSIGDAMRKMGEAMQSLEQRNGSAAGQQQTGAMGSLNEAAQMVQNSINGMMQSGGQEGMGMAGFMQRMQGISRQQQGINQGTQNIGGMSQQQAAEMARLAGEQGMVRKSLEQLAREAALSGQLSKMLGDLNRVAQDMRDVQTDLAQGNVNPETIQKQDRILSRLLDSQRSMRERDYEKKRKSASGNSVARTSPGAIDLTTQEGRNRLRRDLLKALEEGYSRDYEQLIKKYFEALEESDRQNR